MKKGLDKELMKRALKRGIPGGLILAVLYVAVRVLLRGGSFFGNLFSGYGIITLIVLPAIWVAVSYNRAKALKGK